MEWLLFADHSMHYVEQYRKEKQKEAELSKQLANKLTQLQLEELSKQKTKAPVGTVEQQHSMLQ